MIEVRVVNVDAFVRDRRGRPVGGLERDDFEISVDGRAVPIVNFYAAEAPASPPGDAAPPAASPLPPLRLAILVDSSSVEARARNEALDELRGFLRAHLGEGHEVSLASASRAGFAVHHPFTDRLDLVEQGLDEIAATPATDRRAADFQEILQDVGASLAAGNANAQGRMRSLEARIRAFSAEASLDTGRAARDLRRLVDRLAGLPGRKAVLYLGGGLSLRPGEALSGALAEALGRYAALLEEGRPVPELPGRSSEDSSGELLDVARYASVRGVAFYAAALGDPARSAATGLLRGSVEAGAGTTPGQEESFAPSLGLGRRFDLESSLQLLAGATGGLAAAGRGLDGLLEGLLSDARAFYSLGIQPPGGEPGALHRLEVRVRGGGREVRHRESFRALSRDEEAAARVLSAVWTEAGEAPLDLRLESGEPRPVGEGAWAVPVSVQVPVAALAIEPRGEIHAGQVSIFVVAGDGTGAAGPVKKAVFPLTLTKAEILDAMGRVADYRLEVEMPRGPGKIAVGVRDDLDPRLSIRTLEVTVGAAADGPR